MTPTPYPWRVDELTLGNIEAANGEPVIQVQPISPKHEKDLVTRNAMRVETAKRVVAAVNATYGQGIAPEAVAGLVEALEKFREALSDGPENCSYPMYEECEQLSRAALKKARGEK